MDWNLAIEQNRQALLRIVVALVAMAGLTDGASLPRHLHRAILRLLRPAESAGRRLIILLARNVAVTLPRCAPKVEKPKPVAVPMWSLGRTKVAQPPVRKRAAPTARPLAFPLIDPLRDPFRPKRRIAPASPRVWAPGRPGWRRRPLPSPGDPVKASRLALRLQGFIRALDDLPAQARRFARWRARRDQGLTRRFSPLKPGLPPGVPRRNWFGPDSSRRPSHEVYEVLHNLHGLAYEILHRRDTS